MALIIIFNGIAITLVGLGSYAVAFVRDVERILPDHEVAAPSQGERRARLEQLLQARQRLLSEPRTPELATALKKVIRELRELGRS